jgi:hypothetical protein
LDAVQLVAHGAHGWRQGFQAALLSVLPATHDSPLPCLPCLPLQCDIATLALLVLGLLAAAAAHLQATWPAGVAALLVFAPYFFDSRL